MTHHSEVVSSDDEDFFGLYQQSSAANAILYVGLGTVAIGLVISFVGTGEKGFKTLELRLIGPTLIGCGLLCCLVRILLCFCPSRCGRARRKRQRSKRVTAAGGSERCRTAPICAEYDLRPPGSASANKTYCMNNSIFYQGLMANGEEDLALSEQCASLLRQDPNRQSHKKRVSIAPCGNTNTTTYTTQCERPDSNHQMPHCSKIFQPSQSIQLQMQAIQGHEMQSLDVCSVTSSEENLMTVIEVPKIRPMSEPTASNSNNGNGNATGSCRPELLLSPSQLGQ
ncbi:uncharacterized protein LOC113373600 [Ctenocephalides felis]|uniref:uncharacterized protein LOC113373600 n=1 Tax=Ctenocephalides felis TaxID=7515 RepID=UPI000E6E1EBD|nr:uncharacterized protein LOC113373600 [Ctenocephalides felis]